MARLKPTTARKVADRLSPPMFLVAILKRSIDRSATSQLFAQTQLLIVTRYWVIVSISTESKSVELYSTISNEIAAHAALVSVSH